MTLVVYNSTPKREQAIDSFLDAFYLKNMQFLASDLLKKGLSVNDITQAVRRALIVMRQLKLDATQHFRQFYTQRHGHIIKDCKLSKIGYALVIMNLNPNNDYVANVQLMIAEYFFNEHDIHSF